MWWNRIYALLGGGRFEADTRIDGRWICGLRPPITLRCGFRVLLDLRDWSQRRAYFGGDYYQTSLVGLLEHLLRPGDNWVDVGANIGLVTLIAASHIGRTGHGLAFEPNPLVFPRLAEHVAINGLSSIHCYEAALGADSGRRTLAFPKRHTGAGTLLSAIASDCSYVEVDVRRGDDLLSGLAKRPTIIKIDVEGFEPFVVEGLARALTNPETAVIIEVVESFLRRAGSSPEALMNCMQAQGYHAYSFESVPMRWRRRLAIHPITTLPSGCNCDVLFINCRSDILMSRVAPLIV